MDKLTDPRIKDIRGQTFNYLVVLDELPQSRRGGDGATRVSWQCRCVCGNALWVLGQNLRSGQAKSCGCMNRRNTTHGQARSAEYRSWAAMIDRCENAHNPDYCNYGARGVAVCSAWRHSFTQFLADVKPRPTPAHTLDRIDVNGDYEPGNVRWATRIEQGNTMRRNRMLTYQGRTQTVTQWARELSISPNTIRARIRYGWSAERIITGPVATTMPVRGQ